ncbi:hypothetical protein [Thalassovita aquimarina]|uniref:Uncharacterized protein n=1 Tax=Thalassovita aquimarina TaxID=2785917 RepID=A0ABS5HVH0_9RHOB|nr:hypothetical protein [Thalassovita aquimarina]MBR9652971.1 hypothetical protein [Thalassovita aquimarina]
MSERIPVTKVYEALKDSSRFTHARLKALAEADSKELLKSEAEALGTEPELLRIFASDIIDIRSKDRIVRRENLWKAATLVSGLVGIVLGWWLGH